MERQPSVTREIASTLGAYVVGQAKVAAILTCLYSLGYALSGVPYWLFFGVFCGALNVVPVFGSLIGIAVTAYAVLLANGTMFNYVGLLITFVVVQGLEGFWITPRVLGRRVGVSPLFVFVGVLVGGAMFGPVGILLAVPVLAVIGILWRRARR